MNEPRSAVRTPQSRRRSLEAKRRRRRRRRIYFLIRELLVILAALAIGYYLGAHAGRTGNNK